MRPRLPLLTLAVAALALLAACRHAPPVAAAAASRVLLLGEVHDNADGHAARAALLRKELSLLPGVQRYTTTVCMKAIKEGGLLMAGA